MPHFEIPRRLFLQAAAAPVGVALLDRLLSFPQQSDFERFAELRANLLEMVNEERAVAKVPLVQIDDLATQVATRHAVEMATHEFASHKKAQKTQDKSILVLLVTGLDRILFLCLLCLFVAHENDR